MQGVADASKTTTLEAIRQAAEQNGEQNGYAVEGFAPTSRTAQQLRDAGISADTLQGFLAAGRVVAARSNLTGDNLFEFRGEGDVHKGRTSFQVSRTRG